MTDPTPPAPPSENDRTTVEVTVDDLMRQNDRFRIALEFFADPNNYEDFEETKAVTALIKRAQTALNYKA